MAVSVKVITDGPLMVKGAVEMQDGQGNVMPPKGGDTVFLCRCGSSANKPYCDGAHKKIGFKA
ncbi:MAG TPA: CDGSH iron-sulfur domain-containing protein [Methylomirabilota bacterium]|jgi:CDGSH-type Zn-finger protein